MHHQCGNTSQMDSGGIHFNYDCYLKVEYFKRQSCNQKVTVVGPLTTASHQWIIGHSYTGNKSVLWRHVDSYSPLKTYLTNNYRNQTCRDKDRSSNFPPANKSNSFWRFIYRVNLRFLHWWMETSPPHYPCASHKAVLNQILIWMVVPCPSIHLLGRE